MRTMAIVVAVVSLLGCGSGVQEETASGPGGGGPPEECATCYQGTPCGDYRTCRETDLEIGEDPAECAERSPEGYAEWLEIEECEAQ